MVTYTKRLEEILGISINLELTSLALGEVQSRNLWDVLILSLTLLFLELEGDTTDWTTLNTLHQVGSVTSNLTQIPVSPKFPLSIFLPYNSTLCFPKHAPIV
jgi:hypothetical protein